MTGLYNNLEVFAYVCTIDIKTTEKEGVEIFILKGRIKIPLWKGTKDNYCDIVAFNDDAKRLSLILKKGTGGMFAGELVTREYKLEGKQKYATELVVSSFLPMMSTDTFIPIRSNFRGFCTLVRVTTLTENINGDSKNKFYVAKNRIACRTLRNGNLFSDITIVGEHCEKLAQYLTKGVNVFVDAYWLTAENDYTYLRVRDIQLISSKEGKKLEKQTSKEQGSKNVNKKNDSKPLSVEDFKKEGFKPIF